MIDTRPPSAGFGVDEREIEKFIAPLMLEIFLPADGKKVNGFLSDIESKNLAKALAARFTQKPIDGWEHKGG